MTLWKKRNHRLLAAFTIFETMVIMIIIGAIAVFVVPNLTKSIRRMKVKEAENILTVIRGAQMEYAKEHNGAFAGSILNLDIEIPALRHHQPPLIDAGDALICPEGTKTRLARISGNGETYTLAIHSDGGISCHTCYAGQCANFSYIMGCHTVCFG